MKLSYEDKMMIVKMHEEGISISNISEKMGISTYIVHKYLRLFRQYGEEVFKRKKFNSTYSTEFKYEIINRVKSGESKLSLAVEYKVEASMLIKWLRDYEKFGYNGLIAKKRGRPKMKSKEDKNQPEIINNELSSPLIDEERKELIEARVRIKQLEMENEFLKKLDALVQERLKRERKK